jgi:hypothetical protein
MGDYRVTRLWPTYVQSVGKMRDHQVRVAAIGSKCRQWQKVDLDAIIMMRGRSFCLIDQRGPCRIYQCDGSAFFMWSTGESTPYRPLTTDRGDRARIFGKGQGGWAPPDDEPPKPLPPTPAGTSREARAKADSYERKRLLRQAPG